MQNTELFDISHTSTKEAAAKLGVSVATVNNWLKLGVLESESQLNKKNVLISSLLLLQERINTGVSEKLQKRANKKFTTKKRRHIELNENEVDVFLTEIDVHIEKYSLDETLIAIAEKLLDIEIKAIENSSELPVWVSNIRKEIENWTDESKSKIENIRQIYKKLNIIPSVTDLLGKTYQHITESSHKAVGGVFYTPNSLAYLLTTKLQRIDDCVLDPSCGSGSFLIESLKIKLLNKEKDALNKIYGFDIDKIAINICRLNLMLIAKDSCNKAPNIFHKDAIEVLFSHNELLCPKQFDLIATNPPWGADYTLPNNASGELKLVSSDSFAAFLALCLDRLSDKGRMTFLLPESFVDVAAHAAIRKKILRESSNISLIKLGKIFKGLVTNVVNIELVKCLPDDLSIVRLEENKVITEDSQTALLKNKDSSFIFNIGVVEKEILKKLFSMPHKFIGNESKFALGVVTGNNAKLLSTVMSNGLEEILKGKHIVNFKILKSDQYVKFEKNSFQQCADESYYRAEEKLIYRFIANKFIIAYDNQKRLTLNSANILIPNIEIPIKVVLAVLQSNVIQFIFKCKFNTLKILKNHIQAMPIFIFDSDIQSKIENEVNIIIDSDRESIIENERQLNSIIYAGLNLSPAEIKSIESFIAVN